MLVEMPSLPVIGSVQRGRDTVTPMRTRPLQCTSCAAWPSSVVAGGVAPDVMYVNFRQSDSYISQGFLAPLDEEVKGWAGVADIHAAPARLRRSRRLAADVGTMLAGANCETVMGATTHRWFGWVDFVGSGEADGIIAGLCRLALTQGREADPADLTPDVYERTMRRNLDHLAGALK